MRQIYNAIPYFLLLSSALAGSSVSNKEQKQLNKLCASNYDDTEMVFDGYSKSGIKCRKESSGSFCPKEWKYRDPETQETKCCYSPKVISQDSEDPDKEGCCRKGQSFVWDYEEDVGECQGSKKSSKHSSGGCRGGRENSGSTVPDAALPKTCLAFIHDSLAYHLGPVPSIWNTVIEQNINIAINNIKNIILIQEETCGRDDKPDNGPDPVDPLCPTDESPCLWIKIQTTPRSLPAQKFDKKVPLDHPNKEWDGYKHGNNTNYWYTVDTWLQADSADIEVFIKSDKAVECKGNSYFIPAGTLADDVYVRNNAGESVSYTFYGAQTEDTPCVEQKIKPWTYATIAKKGQQTNVDVSDAASSYDIVFTVTDNLVTTEQYAIYIDGEELGRTHGPLYYGDSKYAKKYILNKKLNVPNNAIGDTTSITHGGFFGSFIIPQGTEEVTIKLVEADTSYPWFAFAYRLDKLA